jgi:hypothetical protein
MIVSTYRKSITNEKLRKRQFSRQIENWGFRKNISRAERHKILKCVARNAREGIPELRDRRLKVGKLKNWRRRYREELSAESMILTQDPDEKSGSVAFSKA